MLDESMGGKSKFCAVNTLEILGYVVFWELTIKAIAEYMQEEIKIIASHCLMPRPNYSTNTKHPAAYGYSHENEVLAKIVYHNIC